ncbi:MAG: hypothetical protein V1818_00930 [Candidatus Aenigmatarchaeota archaeon]
MNKIIAALVGLMMLATPVLACHGPQCLPDDATISTFFFGSGRNVWFNDVVGVDERVDDDYVVEDMWTMKGDMTVVQNVNIDLHGFSSAEVIMNKEAWINPAYHYSANVEKEVVWDEEGEVYREAITGGVYSIFSAGADEGIVQDDIRSEANLYIFQSVGLNTGTRCEYPSMPGLPEGPTCSWCQ